MKHLQQIILLLMLTMSGQALSTELNLPHNFEAGKKAVAAEVNANFGAVKSAVDDNHTRLASLETLVNTLSTELAQAKQDITQLTNALTTANSNITTLQGQMFEMSARMLEVEHNSVAELGTYLSVDTVSDSRGPLVRLSGANLQIVNGDGVTNTINGTGNLIIGYDTPRNDGAFFCSYGGYTDEPSCTGNGFEWAVSHKGGSHNLVIGDNNNYSRFGGLVVGMNNTINGNYASVSGGEDNNASGNHSSVSGGHSNLAKGGRSSVSGGIINQANGDDSSVSGGFQNFANGSFSSVSGGYANDASGVRSHISGGYTNTASGILSSISGGDTNTASGDYSHVSGGQYNTAGHNYSSVLGGYVQATSAIHETIPALP